MSERKHRLFYSMLSSEDHDLSKGIITRLHVWADVTDTKEYTCEFRSTIGVCKKRIRIRFEGRHLQYFIYVNFTILSSKRTDIITFAEGRRLYNHLCWLVG